MDPLFLLALQQQQNQPAQIRTIETTPPVPPGFTITPQEPMPQIPVKTGTPRLSVKLNNSLNAVLPIIETEAPDPNTPAPSPADLAQKRADWYQKMQSTASNTSPARVWEDSHASMVVIDRATDQNGKNIYYALTAGHAMVHGADQKPPADEPRAAMTPGGKLEPLTFIGLVEDKNDPAYRGRDMALVAFASDEDIPVAPRATVIPGKLDKNADYIISGFPSGLTKKGDDDIAYGQDFIKDPNVTISPPRIIRGDDKREITPTDIVTQQVTDHVHIVAGTFAEKNAPLPDGRYPPHPLIPGTTPAPGNFNTSASLSYDDANTHSGHSGAPVFNQQGDVIAIHNVGSRDPKTLGPVRGPGLAAGSYLDARTNQIIDQMVNQHILDNHYSRTQTAELSGDTVKNWQEKRKNPAPAPTPNKNQSPRP